jgi:hypothetical protein
MPDITNASNSLNVANISTVVGLEINIEKAKHIFMSYHHISGQNYNRPTIKIVNKTYKII